MAIRFYWSVLLVGLVGCSGGDAGAPADPPRGTLGNSDASRVVAQDEDGGAIDADTGASSPDGDTTSPPDAMDEASAPDAAPDATPDSPAQTASLKDALGRDVRFTRIAALERGLAVTVTFLLAGVPGTGIAPLTFVYGPSAVAGELAYGGVTLDNPLCRDAGTPTASGTATPLVRDPAGWVSGQVVGASVPGLYGQYTATFANLPLTTATCQ